MVDTHCHLEVCEPPNGELVDRAVAAGVTRMLSVGLDEASNRAVIASAAEFEQVFAAVGRHPNSAGGFDDAAARDIRELAADPLVRAVGETGLDFYRDTAPRPDQRTAFDAQIEIAREVAKPLVIHVRDGDRETGGEALEETFVTLRERADGVAVILHCFSAPPERVAEAAERGWYCSFAGNLTYASSERLREAAALVPDELVLVETDAPFLTPRSRRRERNEPGFVVETATVLAEARGVDAGELEALVETNAAAVFGW
ncbi:TatD family hydrolase [Thermoleophilia bacterium SCSIO 60948]|nr:TatD family hydrolase [Thermoleophilia bacterium SCSIO 60948]